VPQNINAVFATQAVSPGFSPNVKSFQSAAEGDFATEKRMGMERFLERSMRLG
jgi:hypothetical protein